MKKNSERLGEARRDWERLGGFGGDGGGRGDGWGLGFLGRNSERLGETGRDWEELGETGRGSEGLGGVRSEGNDR